jgi:lysophospholipase L1-like esterase
LPTLVVGLVGALLGLAAGSLPVGPAVDRLTGTQPTTPAPVPAWTGAWSASPQRLTVHSARNRTVRMVVHPTLGGSAVRIRLSNAFGPAALVVARASVGLAAAPGSADLATGTARPVRFGGAERVTVPIGARTISDPVSLPVGFGQDLVVDLHLPRLPATATGHVSRAQDSFLATGDRAGSATGAPFRTRFGSWLWLEGVDVLADPGVTGTVVVLGDSVTEGSRSTRGQSRRWTDALATRINALPASRRLGVLNHGIVGNRLLTQRECCGANEPALSRIDRDVLSQPGVRAVVVEVGLNDLRHGSSAQEIIAGFRQLTQQLRDAGLRVVGATLTPAGNGQDCAGCLTAEQETTRQSVNTWIRSGEVFDGVLDADRAVRDPARPDQMLASLNAGDHLHPNDAGYGAIAAALDLSLVD